jgi:hypothetical protein
MAQPISFLPTSDDERNLAVLTAQGLGPTDAIRAALDASARKVHRSTALAAEAAVLANDPVDLAAVAEARAALDR